jgi:hypothetical protein
MDHSEHSTQTGCDTGDSCVLERPRYFPRQLITPTELTLEHDYFREKQRLHNRFLHGWGVVCGARVCPVPAAEGGGYEPWTVRVERGYLLDACGNDILIERTRKFDLRTRCQTVVVGEPCGDPADDPWCRDSFERPRTDEGPLYVAVRYREFPRRPVRVQPAGCGCDDSQCEYSRWCDGYEICVLTKCPESHCRTAEGTAPSKSEGGARCPPACQRRRGAPPGPGSGSPLLPRLLMRPLGRPRQGRDQREREHPDDRQLCLPPPGGLLRQVLVDVRDGPPADRPGSDATPSSLSRRRT